VISSRNSGFSFGGRCRHTNIPDLTPEHIPKARKARAKP
jgi:hypothetical protein